MAEWIVIGVHEVARGRVDDLRHLVERQDFERGGLVGLRIADLQPLVLAARAVAQEPRESPNACLKVCANRQFARREVGDVAIDVGIGEVLRAGVEALQRSLELLEVARAVDEEKRLDFLRGAKAYELHADRSARYGIQAYDRAAIAPRHDERERRDCG